MESTLCRKLCSQLGQFMQVVLIGPRSVDNSFLIEFLWLRRIRNQFVSILQKLTAHLLRKIFKYCGKIVMISFIVQFLFSAANFLVIY